MTLIDDATAQSALREIAFETDRLRGIAREAGAEKLVLQFELVLHEIGREMSKLGLPFGEPRRTAAATSPLGVLHAPLR